MCNLTRDECNELDKYSFLRSWHRIGVTMAAAAGVVSNRRVSFKFSVIIIVQL